ncbi:MAG TPA: MT-A70 family methyltransferase [Steroidobacteraceae bacterium]|jgi:N6-adenosine-specific RNA methylase IME4|nr:MT-A70 family methyltransferase [Steroidobacteraceae bacterium]
MNIALAEIRVGKRHRKDMGDIDGLVESMRVLGLLQPIGVTADYELVFGQRRLKAAKKLGWETIAARVIKVDKLLAEQDENEVRKEFTPSERVAITEAIRERITERRGRPGKTNVEVFPQIPAGTKTREHAAVKAGFGNDATYRQAKAVVDRGTADLVRAMDSGGLSINLASKLAERPVKDQQRVATAVLGGQDARNAVRELHREQRIARLAEVVGSNVELGGSLGKHPIIYADPPWRYEHAESMSREIENQYPTMEIADICALPVRDVSTEDAVLFLWATSPKLAEALQVVTAWGFTYRTCMVWDKERIGMGYYARQQHELLLIATVGQPPAPRPEARPPSVIRAPRGEHSSKPVRFYEIIENMYPELPRLELFSRSPRTGWKVWGNQSAA